MNALSQFIALWLVIKHPSWVEEVWQAEQTSITLARLTLPV